MIYLTDQEKLLTKKFLKQGYVIGETKALVGKKMDKYSGFYISEYKNSSPWFNREIRSCMKFYNDENIQVYVKMIKSQINLLN